MFKPVKIEVDAKTNKVEHDIQINPDTVDRIERLMDKTGKTAMIVIAAAAVAKTSSDIIVHIAKSKI